MTDPSHSALVLFSGGQDSATILVHALAAYNRVETIGFDYGQRHAIELDQRRIFIRELTIALPAFAARLGSDHVIDAHVLKSLGETAMTHEVEIETLASGLPNTFVPGRNLLFLTLAGALAVRRGIGVLVGGMCETDFSGYPDCRAETIDAQARTLSLGLGAPMRIDAPLMHLTKAQTWSMAQHLGGDVLVDLIVEHTHTCYLGTRGIRHAWGYGCGTCPACQLRARGFADWHAAR